MSVFRLLGETPQSLKRLEDSEKVEKFEGALGERNLTLTEKEETRFISSHFPEGSVALWASAGIILGVVAATLYR